MKVSFTVPGIAAPQGSKRHVGHGIMVESSKALPAWRDGIIHAARQAIDGLDGYPIALPLNLDLTVRFPRPKSHYRTGKHAGQLKLDAPVWVNKAPDLDKLVRAVCDALTAAGVWIDDSQVATLHARKCYVDFRGPGCDITVQTLPVTA